MGDFFDLANLLDNDGNLQNEMMVASFAATMLATIPVLLGNEFDVNVGLKKRKKRDEDGRKRFPPFPLAPVYEVFALLQSTLMETFKQSHKHKHSHIYYTGFLRLHILHLCF